MLSHPRVCTQPEPAALFGSEGVFARPETRVPARPAKPAADPSLAARFEAALIARIGTQRHTLWFVGNTVVVPAGRDLVLAVSNESFLKWLEQTFGAAVRAAADEAGGGTAAVRFVVDADLFGEPKTTPAAESEVVLHGPKGKPVPQPGPKPTRTLFGDELPPPQSARSRKPKPTDTDRAGGKPGRRWKTLAQFVVGACNRVAFASAQSVIDDPTDCASPLVIHGPVGTGKTHLLEGVCAGLRKAHPDLRPTFITAEEFTTRFVQACRFDKQAAFRRQFRDCPALLIDDLHFLASKPGSQKELIQTLDALAADGTPVVVTMDCHPRLADELMPELVDRLLGGAAWPVQPPDDETRLGILRAKAAAVAAPAIPEVVLKYLARNLKGNVRELEGAVNSVRHFAKVTGRPVDQPLAREALGDLLRHSVRAVTVQDVDEAVCRVLGLAKGTLQSKARNWAVAHPRMLATYLARKHTAATYGEVAKHFGAKTHSTAVAAEKKVRGWLTKNETLAVGDRRWAAKDLIDRIERELTR
jgi:chromosomal replication initiator protein